MVFPLVVKVRRLVSLPMVALQSVSCSLFTSPLTVLIEGVTPWVRSSLVQALQFSRPVTLRCRVRTPLTPGPPLKLFLEVWAIKVWQSPLCRLCC